jgi:type IV secretory pathway TraG/TraD family ATPase VirD4
LYIVGKTGSGKSKLLELLLKADIESGKGCCLIDPHGDLAVEILKYVPKNRINDVVYVDPTDRNFPVGFNPLEPVEDYEMRQHLSTFFIAIFKKLFAGNWNARMENLIRYITLALLETPDSNVLGISRILSDTAYRQRVIKQVQDPVVKSFWTNDFKPSDAQYTNEAIVPLMNKVGQFISNPLIRNIIGQKKNVLPFDEFMNQGKIVIINLSKGKLGEENTALLGSMFITKIQQAALARSSIHESDRKDFYFYVDEFQNFATDAFSSILSEARKYRLDLTIAHQYIAQLPDDVKATAFGNVGTIIVFSVGADDAAYLAKEFAPTFTPDDMISLNTREMYIKMSIDGKITPPFSAKTLTVTKPEFDYSEEIINYSRMHYSQNRAGVEHEIARWSDSTHSIDTKDDGDFPEPII